ncbi:MAG: hypothetical protein HC904_05425, partial [Blastochloris sp.]|nr:hypothetical protein [Blastochloris sp.]
MPFVLEELFQDLGLQREEHLKLHEVNPVCRYFWDDGTVLDEDEHFFRRSDVSRFLKYCSGIYDLSAEAFLMHPPEDFWKAFQLSNWRKLKHLPKVATFRSLASTVNDYFVDPKLRQLFQRFATYNGSDPFRTPATFNVIPYVEAHFRGWYVRDGMARLPENSPPSPPNAASPCTTERKSSATTSPAFRHGTVNVTKRTSLLSTGMSSGLPRLDPCSRLPPPIPQALPPGTFPLRLRPAPRRQTSLSPARPPQYFLQPGLRDGIQALVPRTVFPHGPHHLRQHHRPHRSRSCAGGTGQLFRPRQRPGHHAQDQLGRPIPRLCPDRPASSRRPWPDPVARKYCGAKNLSSRGLRRPRCQHGRLPLRLGLPLPLTASSPPLHPVIPLFRR